MLKPLPDAGSRLRVLMRAALDDRPGANVEAGLLTDSAVPEVRAVLDRATTARTGYLRRLFEELGAPSPHQRATTAFALYLGLLHMRRSNSSQVPRAADLDAYVDSVCHWLVGAGRGHGTLIWPDLSGGTRTCQGVYRLTSPGFPGQPGKPAARPGRLRPGSAGALGCRAWHCASSRVGRTRRS